MSGLELLVSAGAAAATAALLVPARRPGPTRLTGTAPGEHPRWRTEARHPRTDPPPGATGGQPVLRVTSAVSVALGALFLLGTPVGLVAGPVAACVCWWLTGRMEHPAVRRRRERLAAGAPHAVDLLAACLAVGLSPSAAVDEVTAAVDGPLAEELASISARLRLGVDPVTVWGDLSAHPQLGALGRTVSRAVASGASVSAAMLRLAEDLRRGRRAQVESRARAVGVKAALPLGVCLLPAFVLIGVVPLVASSVSVLLGP